MEIEVSENDGSNGDIDLDEFNEDDLVMKNGEMDRPLPTFADHNPDMTNGGMFWHYAMHAYAFQKGVMFLGYGGKGLDKYEVADKRKSEFFKGSVQQKIKNMILFLIAVSLLITVVHPYLMMLGTEKS